MAFDATKECEDYPESWNGNILISEFRKAMKVDWLKAIQPDEWSVPDNRLVLTAKGLEELFKYLRDIEAGYTGLESTIIGIERYKRLLAGEKMDLKEFRKYMQKSIEAARDKFFADHPEV